MPRTSLPWALVIGLVVTGAARADDQPSPPARLKAMQKEVADAETAFRDAMAKLPDPLQDDPAVEKLYKAFQEKQQAAIAEALGVAQAGPKSDSGFDALEWILMKPQAYYGPPGIRALELMAEHHAANPKVGRMIAILAYYPPWDKKNPAHRAAVDLLKAVADKNPDRGARGHAALGLAWQAKRDFQVGESEGDPETERLAAKAEKAFESVVREYGDCPNLRSLGVRPPKATLGAEAEAELAEIRHLGIGQVAPDVEGEDLNGSRFKLSEHRGKVILLVFWASWCGPCMGAVPHERELVARFKGRPFVLIGVNGDQEKEKATKAVDQYNIPWRSFWNGKEGPGGPIATAWNVRGWPTLYVIDHQGVIRQKYLIGNDLDGPLEKLVAAAESSKARGQ